MAITITCRTLFDITATGVRSHYKSARVPFTDETGRVIDHADVWMHARNQQRNWETINQIISLRALPQQISTPRIQVENNTKFWEFDFELEAPATVAVGTDPVGALLADAADVPMIVGLDETPSQHRVLQGKGSDPNLWFFVLDGK